MVSLNSATISNTNTMDISIFTNKEKTPTEDELKVSLGVTFDLWMILRNFVFDQYPPAKEEWNYSGLKYGWSFRIKDKKRAILYLLPREHYFKVAFVFGQKATDEILNSEVSDLIKAELKTAKVYAEGRGIRIDVKESANIADIKKLIEIKLAN
jgi:hypothetical protein